MNNLFEVWRHYNKTQLELSKGPFAQSWVQHGEELANDWGQQEYPKGEYWKYLSFGDLKTTKLETAQSSGNNDQWVNEDSVTIQISDFSEMTNIQFSLLPKGLKIYNHKDILDSENLSQRLKNEMAKLPKQENNPFAKVSQSFFGLGLVLVVEQEAHIDKPVRIVFDLNQMKNKDSLVNYSLQIIAERQSAADIYLENHCDQFTGLSNIRLDIFVERSSQLNFYSKEIGGFQSRCIQNLFANVEKDAVLKVFDTTLPSLWSRHNSTLALLSQNASTQMKGIYLNNKDFFCDHHTEIQHLKEYTFSSQNYKGILSDRAKAVFNGKVFIEKYARQSNSEQVNKNLMLSKKAEVDTKPELQIYNDDVKASHGATIGQMDNEQLFYLMSRGYSQHQAWSTLARAFIYDLFEGEKEMAVGFYEKDIAAALHMFEELSDVF